MNFNQIRINSLKHVYLLFGDEPTLIQKYLNRVIDKLLTPEDKEMCLNTIEGEIELDDLSAIIATVPFMGEKQVVVVKNSLFFAVGKSGLPERKQKDIAIEDILADIPEYTYLIFLTHDKIDRRKKAFKAVQKYGEVIEFASPKVRDIKEWLEEQLAFSNKKITTDAKEHLLSVFSMMPKISFGFVEQEINKLFLYTLNKETITIKDLDAILADVPEVSIFALLEAVSDKKLDTALGLLNDELLKGQHPLLMIALLNRQVRMLWQGKVWSSQGMSVINMAEKWKVPSFVVEKTVRRSRTFSSLQLKEAVVALANADRDLKTGKISLGMVEKIIISLCNKK